MFYKIADVVFEINPRYSYASRVMRKYETEQSSDAVSIVLDYDKVRETAEKYANGLPLSYYESTEIDRLVSMYLLENAQGIFFHGSSLAVRESAVAFAAPSGTGKSTHARFWREQFGSDVETINDDKPFIRLIGNEFFIYGSPWNGKHNLDSNVRRRLDALVFLSRGEKNSITPITSEQAIPLFFNQTIIPSDPSCFDKLFLIADKLLGGRFGVKLYSLSCTLDKSAAITACKELYPSFFSEWAERQSLDIAASETSDETASETSIETSGQSNGKT